MSELAPLVIPLSRVVPAAAQAADASTAVGIAPFGGTVSSVRYIADTAITGADTDTRKVSLINRGADGTGTTVVATLTFESGTDAAAFEAVAVTLEDADTEEDPDPTVVEEGDVLEWKSEDVGAGLADPGGTVYVYVSRS